MRKELLHMFESMSVEKITAYVSRQSVEQLNHLQEMLCYISVESQKKWNRIINSSLSLK